MHVDLRRGTQRDGHPYAAYTAKYAGVSSLNNRYGAEEVLSGRVSNYEDVDEVYNKSISRHE